MCRYFDRGDSIDVHDRTVFGFYAWLPHNIVGVHDMFVFSRSLQLLMIFVNEKLSSFIRFYETHKDFVDGLGKFVVSKHLGLWLRLS